MGFVTTSGRAVRGVGAWRLPRRTVLLAIAAFISLALSARAVQAYAVLLRSNPPQNARLTTPPQRLDLFFSEAFVDSANHVWLAQESAGTLGRFDAATDSYTALQPPTPNAAPTAVALDDAGSVWFTEQNVSRTGRYDPATQSFREFPLPHGGAALYWLAVAPDGRVWFTEFGAHRIGELDPASGAVTEYAVPNGESPAGIAADQTGVVWFAATAGSLVRVDPRSGAMTRYASPVNQLYGVAIGDGKVWAGSSGADAFVAFDAATGAFTSYLVPAGSGPWWPAVGPAGSVWIALASSQANALGRLAPAPSARASGAAK